MTRSKQKHLVDAMQITKTTVKFTTRGTIAIVRNANGYVLATDMAALNPKDIPDPIVGAALALGRCYQSIGIELERLGTQLDHENCR